MTSSVTLMHEQFRHDFISHPLVFYGTGYFYHTLWFCFPFASCLYLISTTKLQSLLGGESDMLLFCPGSVPNPVQNVAKHTHTHTHTHSVDSWQKKEIVPLYLGHLFHRYTGRIPTSQKKFLILKLQRQQGIQIRQFLKKFIWAMACSASMWGPQPRPWRWNRQSPNHWTTRELPTRLFLILGNQAKSTQYSICRPLNVKD